MTCPFCDPREGLVFHRGELVLGIWDAFPVSEGHALLITRRHVESWFDATSEERAELVAATEIARRIIEERYDCDGYSLGVNVGTAAGQTVPHLHLHVIPRRQWDVPDPTGGVRNVIPGQGRYGDSGGADAVRETAASVSVPDGSRPAIIGGPEDPLLPHLVAHLDRARQADLLVSFVLESGLSAIEDALRGFLLRGGRLRLLTGDYLGVTDPRALLRLVDLADFARVPDEDADQATERGRIELRVFECERSSSFHPKAYVFQFSDSPVPFGAEPDGIAYVGSSNLTRTALGQGIEWNYSLVVGQDRLGFQRVMRSFEELFRHPSTRPLTTEWIEDYRRRRPAPEAPGKQPVPVPNEEPEPPPDPHDIQGEALTALDATRIEGNEAGLVVMATGLGKTWLAAFDVARFGSRRTLFVAHRDEILRQAQRTFRRILPEARLGLYTGQEKAPEADVLFASIQTLGRSGHLNRFAPSAFDYIVVDEFHHAAARTYARLIEHFRPRFLLGLTATPERTDGGNLLTLCDENLVYRCDLFDAIRRSPDRLVPFRYYGVPDEVNYENIPWRGRRFDVDELTRHVATQARADNALEQWRTRGGDRTLGFCCSQGHADFMAEHFRAAGVDAVALHTGPTSAGRATSLEALAQGELQVVFAVDILNEGVDLPDVDTVLMLRPTESRILFLQQLGRGLRTAPGKTHLTVVDYIGNHRSFRLKPEALLQLPPGDASLRRVLRLVQENTTEELDLPPGCSVTYELEAIELLRAQLRQPRAAEELESWYQEFKERTGERPLAVEALHERRNPRAARTAHGSWLRFVAAQGDLTPAQRALVEEDGLPGAFLAELERTTMTKSFKMLTLLSLLRLEALPGSAPAEELTKEFARLARRSARLRSEVMPDLDDTSALRSYLERNPIQAWGSPQGPRSSARTYFEYTDGLLRTTFDVPPEATEDFRALVRELAEWRLADYLETRDAGDISEVGGGLRIVCRVIQAGGRPILKLPDRDRNEEIPTGELALLVEQTPHVARFAKEFVNMVRPVDGETNVLPDLARRWFGPSAGQPGTRFLVGFTRTEGRWTLAPLTASPN